MAADRTGSFSFPAVPPGAALEYEVEMLQWEAANEENPRSEMLFEERLEAGVVLPFAIILMPGQLHVARLQYGRIRTYICNKICVH
jgi:hypothetical protein